MFFGWMGDHLQTTKSSGLYAEPLKFRVEYTSYLDIPTRRHKLEADERKVGPDTGSNSFSLIQKK